MYLTFGLLSILGLSKLDDYNQVNATVVLEGLFLFLSFITIISSNFKQQEKKFLSISILIILYILVSGVIAIGFQERNVMDFLGAYKAFFYISIICLYIKDDVFSLKVTKNIFYFLLIVFLLKYSTSRLFFGILRPGVFTENNFELGLLCLMYLALSDFLGKYKSSTFIVLAVVIVLSGSRSGVASLCVLYFATHVTKIDLRLAFKLGTLVLLFYFSFILFMNQADGDVANIDRYRFLLVFLDEIESWGIVNYLFGTMPITPLQPSSCSTLSFYDGLYSYSGDGTCYPVILHAYLLRVILVHGLIGLFAMLFIYWLLFAHSRLSKAKILGFFMIVLCNSLSVSAVNSIYFTFGILFIMSSKSWHININKIIVHKEKDKLLTIK
jgi:hypothetical protein